MKNLKRAGKVLIDNGDNVEYTRGICELIADIDGIEDMPHAERSIEIAFELGVPKSTIDKFYSTTRSSLATIAERIAYCIELWELPDEAVAMLREEIDQLNKLSAN